ncbi:MAG: 1-pyrroline-5-carboxylate dehydrogenase [candidate division Zixibacteria bacterium HGW-Zixibacteria-1]|nr:MAG: 1-pyrroline-5-carboxylate dehydrogenase [candidate division Zixibacteria bacterium HGW-Zixibacteria-1]
MGNFKVPIPKNEPVLDYKPGSAERAGIDKAVADLKAQKIDVPMVIGGQEIRVGDPIKITSPHDHSLELGQYYQGGKEQIEMAINAAAKAKKDWEFLPWEEKAAIFLKAADLLTGPYRYKMNAATMLAHSKSIFQAEIDAVCELADFFRYNVYYAEQIFNMQPDNAKGIWDRLDYRPLEGFIFAVTPFNFVSIAGNLPTAPAIMGNTVIWKPASSVTYTAYIIMQILKEAGLPDGVVNMVTARGADVGEYVLKSPDLAGIHFTGSTGVFQTMWKTVGTNIAKYKSYPRIVGETGGKDFIFVHNSANVEEVATAIIRGAFEFQGQKCSAASRSYIPKSLWPKIKEKLQVDMKDVKMGGVEDVGNFVNAIIDRSAYNDIVAFIDYTKEANDAEFLCGGHYDDSKGWFIEPTIVVTTNPKFKLMEEEIFGPVMTIYIYEDNEYEKTLELCDETSPYALTGAIFARDRKAVVTASKMLRQAAGNFYINDKPTGAVVAQQPFGGARASGTNDKAGSWLNMIRWTSPRSIKENFLTPRYFKYPFMG